MAPLQGALQASGLDGFTGVARAFLELGATNCEALVNNHFLVFADVQEAARARREARIPAVITEGNLDHSFFAKGLSNGEGEILWGFSQWCGLLRLVPP